MKTLDYNNCFIRAKSALDKNQYIDNRILYLIE